MCLQKRRYRKRGPFLSKVYALQWTSTGTISESLTVLWYNIRCTLKGELNSIFWNQHGNIQIRAKVHTINQTILKLLALSVPLHLQSNYSLILFFFLFFLLFLLSPTYFYPLSIILTFLYLVLYQCNNNNNDNIIIIFIIIIIISY